MNALGSLTLTTDNPGLTNVSFIERKDHLEKAIARRIPWHPFQNALMSLQGWRWLGRRDALKLVASLAGRHARLSESAESRRH